MQAITHLLCPVDLSEPAGQALRYAAALSSVVNGDVTILYVRAAEPRQPDAEKCPDIDLETFAAQLIGVGPAIRFEERHGDPVIEIIGAAAGGGFDAIVMGTHGRRGLERLLLGSVTERVIRRSPVPVLTVPSGLRKDAREAIRVETVLCAVDFSEPSARAVGYGASIAAAADGRLLLAHALEWSEEVETTSSTRDRLLPSSEDDAIARMNELVTEEMRMRCALELIVGYGRPADEVLRVVHERHVHLLVLGISRRNLLDRALFGSTAQRVIRARVCPVLTVRTP